MSFRFSLSLISYIPGMLTPFLMAITLPMLPMKILSFGLNIISSSFPANNALYKSTSLLFLLLVYLIFLKVPVFFAPPAAPIASKIEELLFTITLPGLLT